MNEKTLKVLIPLFAVVVLVESLVLISKLTQKPAVKINNTVPELVDVAKPIDLKWGTKIETVKTGVTTNIPLSITSVDSKLGVDAVDLYINYDPKIAEVMEVTVGKGFPAPTFKKINNERGLVVLNFLISDVNGYVLNKNLAADLINLKVNFLTEGTVDFSLGEASLVVENTTAKVLPFNSEKLVINVTR
jgi:hypothetical protein